MNSTSTLVRSNRVLRFAVRGALLAWAGFWIYFVLAVTFGEPPPPPWWIPTAWITGLAALAFAAWRWPGMGGLALIGAGLVLAAKFDHPGARALLSAPAIGIGIASVLLGRRTHRASVLVAVVACSMPSACAASQEASDLPFRTSSILRHENGRMQRAELVDVASIRGIECRSWVWWYDDGGLDNVELAHAARVQDHDFPTGTRVFFDRDGRLAHAWLSEDTVIDGRLCRGRWKIDTAFHANGRIKAFFPPRAIEIDGVVCAASLFHPVYLHPDGSLRQCALAEEAVIAGRTFERGAVVELPLEDPPR